MIRSITTALAASTLLASAAMAQDIKPAVVFDMGGKFDKSFNEGIFGGLERLRTRPALNTVSSWSRPKRSVSRPCGTSRAAASIR